MAASLPVPLAASLPASLRRRPLDRQSVLMGLACTALVNGLLVGGIWLTHHRGADKKTDNEPATFVDAKLVRFGKKRDLSFLPHVQASPQPLQKKQVLKLTQDANQAPSKLPREEHLPEPDRPLPRVEGALPNLRDDPDDRATKEAAEEGDPNGVRGGTAQEASGDPYIREIMAAITERWTVPTMLTPGQLAQLQAAACLRIDDDGKLVEFKIVESSHNDLFDGSLMSTLGAIRELPKPHGRFAGAARRGKLCPVFTKQ